METLDISENTGTTTSINRLFSLAKGALLGILLAAGALTFAVAGPSGHAAHAAAPPQITALGLGGSARVWGFNFTPDGIERIQLLDSASHVLATKYVRAYSQGQIGWTQLTTGYVGSVTVQASKYQCYLLGIRPLCRYWTQSTTKVYVYAAPHIDQAYAEHASAQLWASGFTPGSLVRFELLDANFHLLDVHYVTADHSGSYLNGTADTYLNSGSYRGRVWLVAYGSPHQSNWVSLNITS
jgi:hypothetical protein